jgi:iron(III) transport system permease protein
MGGSESQSMTTCMVLDRPGSWRVGSLAALLALPLLPTLPLLWFALGSSDALTVGGMAFARALANSAIVALVTAVLAFGVGLPVGVLNALYDYRGRRLLLTFTMLPLLVPPFLWAVGWRCFLEHFGRSVIFILSGYSGCVLVFLPGAVTLVLFTSLVTTASLAGSQVEAARLAGGERTLLRLACRHAAIPAMLAAVLAAILTLSDPGAGFAIGLPVASSEILISFTAFYDYALAGRQCLMLALLVLAAALPLAAFAAPRLAAERPARSYRPAQRQQHPGLGQLARGLLLMLSGLLTLLPIWGLILPLKRWIDVTRACNELVHTGLNTTLYAAGAGCCAAALGLALAFAAGREQRLRRLVIGVCLPLFALPPMLLALGMVRGTARLPEWTDPLLRGRAGVCVALGLRFLPVAAVLALRSWGTMAPALARAAGVHGVPLVRYLWSVVLPLQRRALVMAILLVGLLATAEIGMVLLLHPPGEETLPLRIFQIVGYPQPGSRLAALCAVDLALASAVLALTWCLGGDRE